jgi:hypothetical protein
MYFTIGPAVLRDLGFPRIPETSYVELKSARDCIYWLFSLHEDYDIALENYIELEKSLFSITLENVVGPLFAERTALDAQRRLLCRRLSNFLESISSMNCRLDKRLASTFGRNAKETSVVKSLREHHCNSSASYRLVMSLRTFSQHFGVPVHGVSQVGEWEAIEDDAKSRRVHTTEPYIALGELAYDRKIDATMLEEAKKRAGSSAALLPEVRATLSALSSFLKSIQKEFQANQEAWLELIDSTICCYKEQFPNSLCTAKWASAGHLLEDVHLTVDWRSRLALLQKRHLPLPKLEKVEISSLRAR